MLEFENESDGACYHPLATDLKGDNANRHETGRKKKDVLVRIS